MSQQRTVNEFMEIKTIRGNLDINVVARMVWQLYLNKVLNSFQTLEILTAIGFAVEVRRDNPEDLKGYWNTNF